MFQFDAAGGWRARDVRVLGGESGTREGARVMATRFFFLAAVLVTLAVLGFAMPSPLFGVFETTPTLNIIHGGAGVMAAIAATRGLGTMRACGQILGYTFAALSVAGMVTDAGAVAHVLPLTNSNVWFHLVATLVFLYYALLAPPTL
jgi:hypothetical protein